MTTAVHTRNNPFNEKAKKALKPGQEITSNGLVYRKRKDGFGTWRYDYTASGQRLKGKIGSDAQGMTLSQARLVLTEIQAKEITDRLSGKTGRSTQACRLFEEVAREYMEWARTHLKSQRHSAGRLKNHLLPRFSGTKLSDVTTAKVEVMRSELIEAGYNTQTNQRIVSLLSCIFEHAKKSDQNLDNPTTRLSRVKHQDKEVVPFTREETEAMFRDGVPQYQTITRGPRKGEKRPLALKTAEFGVLVGLALFAGLRASEALALSWKHVDLEHKRIRVQQTAHDGQIRGSTKSYKSRVVPITVSLRPLLEKLHELHVKSGREEGLLLSSDGQKPYNQIQVMFRRIKVKAGITQEGGYHALRHTFATRAIENHVNLPTLQKWLGHSNISVTMRYVHSTEEHLMAAADKLD